MHGGYACRFSRLCCGGLAFPFPFLLLSFPLRLDRKVKLPRQSQTNPTNPTKKKKIDKEAQALLGKAEETNYWEDMMNHPNNEVCYCLDE